MEAIIGVDVGEKRKIADSAENRTRIPESVYWPGYSSCSVAKSHLLALL
jgi:hypothetical protein